MLDLSHWDFSNNFSGYAAAALIQGVDPNYAKADHYEVMIAFERMKEHYQQALNEASSLGFGYPFSNGFSATALPSVELVDLQRTLLFEEEETSHAAWVKAKRQNHFQDQKFSREALVIWLRSTGLTSIYPFDPSLKAAAPKAAPLMTEKPLRNRERDTLLKLVIGMAIKGYSYEPTASKNTAIQEIADDLADLGMSIDPDTVRNHLKNAVNTVLPRNPRQL